MAVGKKTREAVYQKYGGRCAYCGMQLSAKASCWPCVSVPAM